MRLIEGIDYFVRIVPLPWQVRGMTATNPDGTFSVYLNSRYGWDITTIDHEVSHIINGDFYNGQPIQMIEKL